MDPIAIKLLEFYPEPNIPDAALSRNYLALQNHVTDKDQFTQRIDFAENSKSFWFGRFSWTNENVLDPNLKDNGQVVQTNVKQVMVSNTRTLSPSVVNELRFGATKFYNNLAQELQYKRDVHKEVGLGLFDPPPISWGLPNMTKSLAAIHRQQLRFSAHRQRLLDSRHPFHEDRSRGSSRYLQHGRHTGNPWFAERRQTCHWLQLRRLHARHDFRNTERRRAR